MSGRSSSNSHTKRSLGVVGVNREREKEEGGKEDQKKITTVKDTVKKL